MPTSICWTRSWSLSDANLPKREFWMISRHQGTRSSSQDNWTYVILHEEADLHFSARNWTHLRLERQWDRRQTIPRDLHIEKYLNGIEREGKRLRVETWTSLKMISRISGRTATSLGLTCKFFSRFVRVHVAWPQTCRSFPARSGDGGYTYMSTCTCVFNLPNSSTLNLVSGASHQFTVCLLATATVQRFSHFYLNPL